ncbi:uncharacterized protein LOC122510502 [Leptopilina heterotoma]|uniref:uncharacterized protein LOC122510502 n=1 Tax=Leptopilina heterotoma TaxID=63436 RepID=UPI001CAA113B|nr:uncharacterized protein LOC122510502 [Leptopilina heterotoma]
MKWFIIFACFVAAQIVHGADVYLVQQNIGAKRIYLPLRLNDETVKSCSLTTNKGENVTVPVNETEPSVNIALNYDEFDGYDIKINDPSAELNGLWSINIETTNNLVVDRKIYIQIKNLKEFEDIVRINIYENQYAILKLPLHFPKLEVCMLQVYTDYHNTHYYDILSEKANHLSINESNKCGVKIQRNETDFSNYLHLYASDINSHEIYKMSFEISFISSENNHMPQVEHFPLGKRNVIIFPKDERAEPKVTYCQLEDPAGKKLPIQSKSCSYEIPYVTKYHDGVWRLNYGFVGSTDSMTSFVNVTTYDQLTTSVNYHQTENSINLLCQVRYKEKQYYRASKYCLFTRSDNFTLSVTPGIGSEKYQYYGDGDQQDKYLDTLKVYDCGLTIKSPSLKDYSPWKCTMHIKDDIFGSILNIDDSSRVLVMQQHTAISNKLYVQKGTPFMLKCLAGQILDYCWFLSPNGTAYSVSKNRRSPTDLTYQGSGLEFGECGAVVEVADNSHDGNWSCHMGASNTTEMTARISVTVTDSLLIAEEKIYISYKNPTILNCNLLPGYDNVINYCRWIRPDGSGIYNNVDNKYVTERTLSSCKLTIQEIEFANDIGTWHCVAGISGGEMREATTQIQIKYAYIEMSGTISIILGIALLVITTITLFVVIIRNRRTRQVPEKILEYKPRLP